jgi:hypothetical protein
MTVATLIAAFAWSLSGGPEPTAAIVPSLLLLREVRHRDLRPADAQEDRPMQGGPILELTLGVPAPAGVRVAQITQPTDLAATDSTGQDLTTIPANVFGDLIYVEEADFSADLPTFIFRLAATARSASTFTLSATAHAVVFEGHDEVDIPQSAQWTPLDHPTLKELGAQARFESDDSGARLVFRPGSVRGAVDGVYPAAPDVTLTGYSISYDDDSITFEVSPPPEPNQKLRLFVRRGLRNIPLSISLKDQPLP